jgi:hypothetical protein
LVEAARFWEARRLPYNGILTLIVLLWLALTWPHFRPALTLDGLGKMLVLALLANVCFCFANEAEFFLRGAWPPASWGRFRLGVLVLGMLLAVVLENYWIADEIYPHMPQAAVGLAGAGSASGRRAMASNMNFPAPLAIVGFLGASGGLFLGVAAAVIFWFARKPKLARLAALAVAIGAAAYFALLFGFSAGSRDTSLARGQEKIFLRNRLPPRLFDRRGKDRAWSRLDRLPRHSAHAF